MTCGRGRRSHLLASCSVACAIALSAAAEARAQPPPFGIVDNSFLVEESFNQDMGTFQHIFTWTRSRSGEWVASFTQEWPALVTRHQVSYSVPVSGASGSAHLGSVQLNYRYQVLNEGEGRPAFAPRVSAILPTGSSADATDRPGLQVNLPISKQSGRFYLHANAGLTWLHGVAIDSTRTASLTSPHIAGSVIWNTRPLLNLLVETVAVFEDRGFGRKTVTTVSPGFRGGWNVGEQQVVVGAAVPVTMSDDGSDAGLLGYVSYELPFPWN